MAWRGSASRSFFSVARAMRSTAAPLPRIRPTPVMAPPRIQAPRFNFANPRTLGEIGSTQSLLTLHSIVAAPRLTSHLAVNVRACCELSQGTFCRTCPDR
ncbi:hypothetical protein MKW92_045109 [Papaver armeniacum]|nr:hypothetical protein MKW92_045109 [Papaver armeniacum]